MGPEATQAGQPAPVEGLASLQLPGRQQSVLAVLVAGGKLHLYATLPSAVRIPPPKAMRVLSCNLLMRLKASEMPPNIDRQVGQLGG
jgi:hypothetical protein